jgi:hypothetical protein
LSEACIGRPLFKRGKGGKRRKGEKEWIGRRGKDEGMEMGREVGRRSGNGYGRSGSRPHFSGNFTPMIAAVCGVGFCQARL